MPPSKTVAHFVAVSDPTQPPEVQEGLLISVTGRGGDSRRNREQALEILNQMWEDGEIPDEQFPAGISQANLHFVPPLQDDAMTTDSELAPIVQGAQEIIQLTKFQIEAQEAAQEASPYVPIIAAILERSRPLTPEEMAIAKEKKYGKILERFGAAIAHQEEFQAQCSGHGKLILNAIAWQLSQTQPAPPSAAAPPSSEEE
jgi:hypothetical protein